MNHLLFAEPSPGPAKAAMAILGRCTTELRLPMTPASPSLVEQLRGELRTLGML
jgi:4-hydroxy-tetrahydrodipicolinate synthase